ncbi:START-like domain superfamily [Sesbania bispinosa]|nr:START-like domain superfamily [Sesbania bispinosa]
MGVYTFVDEEISSVAPAKLYNALVKDSDEIIPKVIDVIQSGKTSYVLHKVEEIDEANLGYNYSFVGGSGLEEILEKVSFETKVLPGPNGGSVGRVSVTYHTKGDAVLSEEVRESTKAKGTALFKAVEGYLLANPNY